MCPGGEVFPFQPMAKLVAFGPFQRQKFQSVRWIVHLRPGQHLAVKGDRPRNGLTRCDL